MLVEHFGGHSSVAEESGLADLLAQRHGDGFNEYWLSGEDRFPCLSIVVWADLAALHYFPEEGHPGCRSVGGRPGLPADGTTVFRTNTPDEELHVINEAVVPASTALSAGCEFLKDPGALPRSVQWFEL